MILHKCLSGHTWLYSRSGRSSEKLRHLLQAPRQAQLRAGEVAGQVRFSTAGVGYTSGTPRQYFLTGSSTWGRHTRPLHAPERAGRSSNMREQEVVPSKVLRPKGPALYDRVTEVMKVPPSYCSDRYMATEVTTEVTAEVTK